ncbi:MAG TPA: hypothetical protein PKO42_00445 [Tenuifilaceae bacterium]|nr:hypothetical protein [Tenuifilaceae bacterium]
MIEFFVNFFVVHGCKFLTLAWIGYAELSASWRIGCKSASGVSLLLDGKSF